MDSPYSLASATLVPILRLWTKQYVPGSVAAARSSTSGVGAVKRAPATANAVCAIESLFLTFSYFFNNVFANLKISV